MGVPALFDRLAQALEPDAAPPAREQGDHQGGDTGAPQGDGPGAIIGQAEAGSGQKTDD